MKCGATLHLAICCAFLSGGLVACSEESPVRSDASSASAEQPVDGRAEGTTMFSCSGGTDLELVFLGPETVQISLPNGEFVLQRTRTASGTRYLGDGIDFWNHGAEARLVTNDGEFQCYRQER
jgi:membrane-bound inhibitor of C-type lysozyme